MRPVSEVIEEFQEGAGVSEKEISSELENIARLKREVEERDSKLLKLDSDQNRMKR